jgi:hypothetical protein
MFLFDQLNKSPLVYSLPTMTNYSTILRLSERRAAANISDDMSTVSASPRIGAVQEMPTVRVSMASGSLRQVSSRVSKQVSRVLLICILEPTKMNKAATGMLWSGSTEPEGK